MPPCICACLYLQLDEGPGADLGQGMFGVVKAGTYNGQPVAIKVLHPAIASDIGLVGGR